jgi:hypothetical protein
LILTTTATPPIGQLPIVSQYSGWTTYRMRSLGTKSAFHPIIKIQGILQLPIP